MPTLVIDNAVLSQSVAILEYLEERRPESWRLMPQEASARAKVRMLMLQVCADTQPLQNLRVMKYFAQQCQNSSGSATTAVSEQDLKVKWARYWIQTGLEALEVALAETAGKFCYGDNITLADVCLVPQVYNARRFGVEMGKMPLIVRIDAALSVVPAFIASHPDQCPDAQQQ